MGIPCRVVFGLVCLPTLALAGAWARDAGGVYLQLGPSLFVGEHREDLVSDLESADGRFTGHAVELYAEVGLGSGFELDLSTRWVDHRHELEDEELTETGLGDVELLGKWAPLSALHAVSFVLGTRVAAYETPSLAERVGGAPPLGPGGVDLLAGFGWGRSFWPRRAWMNVDLLHRVRLGGASSGLRFRAEAGHLWGPVGLVLQGELQPAYGRAIDQPEDAPGPVPDVLSLGGKALVAAWAGLGLSLEGVWLPEVFNDGPGYRLAAAITYER